MEQLKQLYKDVFSAEPTLVEALPASGGNRKYFRISCDAHEPVIGVIGTNADENASFCKLTQIFNAEGLNVPQLYGHTADYLRYLQEDLGSTTLFDAISEGRKNAFRYSDEERELIKQTISLLPRFQYTASKPEVFSNCYQQPASPRDDAMNDLNYFKYDFLKLIGIEFDETMLNADFSSLAQRYSDDCAEFNTFLYRDFQARNVMIKDGKPYFIDYQGGRRGAIFYDVASFLWQASSGFSDEIRDEMISAYLEALKPYCDTLTFCAFKSRLNLFVLMRTLQVLGAYGLRGLWEKKKHFIDSIPLAISNLHQLIDAGAADDYPYLKTVCRMVINWQTNSKTPSPSPKEIGNDCPRNEGRGEGLRGLSGIRVFSFSFKKGIPSDTSGNGGGYVFDCRSSNNPGRYDEYKPLTGLDQPVIDFLEKDGEIVDFLNKIYPIADFHVQRWIDRGFTDLMFCFGCTGGRHRSVYSAQHLAEHIHEKFGIPVYLCHREQGIETILK